MNLFKHEINVASPQTMVKITKYVREDLKNRAWHRASQ